MVRVVEVVVTRRGSARLRRLVQQSFHYGFDLLDGVLSVNSTIFSVPVEGEAAYPMIAEPQPPICCSKHDSDMFAMEGRDKISIGFTHVPEHAPPEIRANTAAGACDSAVESGPPEIGPVVKI